MKKILILILGILFPQFALAQYDGLPIVGVPANTNCLSFGNNGVCNTFSPAGPTVLTSAFLFPSNPADGTFKQALVPINTLLTYEATTFVPVSIPSQIGWNNTSYPISPSIVYRSGSPAIGSAGITPEAFFDRFSTAR